MKQVTLVVENRVGVLADISFILGRSKINIDSISVSTVGDKVLFVFGLKDDTRAVQLLEANGYKVMSNDSLVVRLPNHPGELAKMSKLLADEGIRVDNVLVISQDEQFSLYSIRPDKFAKAQKALTSYLKLD